MTEPSSTSIITLHFVAEGDVRPGAGTAAKSPRPRLSHCDFDDEGLPRMTGGDNDHRVDNGARVLTLSSRALGDLDLSSLTHLVVPHLL